MTNEEQNALWSLLDRHTAPADPALYHSGEENKVTCCACAQRCSIGPGRRGVCRMRHNRDGVLYAPRGYVAGLQADPIEKKPFYHVLPGCDALSFGMLGCNFHCDFCQNWVSSQTLRDADAVAGLHPCSAEFIVDAALQRHAPVLVSTYNEPLITAEWAAEVFQLGKKHGLISGFVSNGFATPEVLEYLRPFMDLYKVDLKCFSEEGYRQLGGRLKPVLASIEKLLQLGFWVEVVTLVVPGFNDSGAELDQIAGFLASLSVDIPWHVTAFYPTYKRTDTEPTSGDHLERAWSAGKAAGLRYVYAGNRAGRVGDRENTFCPGCHAAVIERRGFQVLRNGIKNGACPHCGEAIAGRWA